MVVNQNPSGTFSTLVGLVLLITCISFTSSASFEEDNTFTPAEKEALVEFKKQVLPKIPESSYVQKFAQDDLYLINWLRAGNLKVKTAVDMLMKHLAEKIDTIDKEDWSDFVREFPLYCDTVDKEGRPIVEMWFSEWKTRKAVLAGNLHKLTRFESLSIEQAARKVYERRAEGSNVTRALIIADLEGANVIEQICPACLPVYLTMASNMENNYPFLINRYYLLNMPPAFEIVLRLIRPTLRASTREAIIPYVSKDQWIKVIDEIIDKDQRSVRFGGTVVHE